jgi:cell division protein FtsW
MNRRALNPDYLLLIITFLLVAVGVFMVFDSSYARAGETARLGRDSFYYMKKQAIAAAIGLIAMQIISRRPYWKLRKLAVLALPFSISLLVLVWLPGLRSVHAGAHRWIKLPSLGDLQCSEAAKLALILYLAHVGAASKHRVRRWGGLAPRLAAIGVLAGMVVVEPDLGTALVIVAIGCAMLIASGMKWSHLAALLGGLAGLGVLAVLTEPYRVSRIMAFRDPWKYYNGSGYQIVHSLVALGSGGAWGRGLAHGIQKFFYLPAGHTDFIFATVGEELGLAGTLMILTLFLAFFYRGMAIAHRTKDPFGMLLAVGISVMVGTQALLNIAVVSSSVPATGVPLPFISFGGSSLILTLIAVGALVNISKYPDPNEPAEGEKARDEDYSFGRGNGGTHLPRFEHG